MMTRNIQGHWLRVAIVVSFGVLLTSPVVPAVKNIAVVVAAGSKLEDVPLADLLKMCKGTQKTWADGKAFILVMKDPEAADLRIAVQKLFGVTPGDLKTNIGKINESHQIVKIVDSDSDLLHTIEATQGAVGILDVYAINSSVKVLRVDGKLPFDVGYAFKGN